MKFKFMYDVGFIADVRQKRMVMKNDTDYFLQWRSSLTVWAAEFDCTRDFHYGSCCDRTWNYNWSVQPDPWKMLHLAADSWLCWLCNIILCKYPGKDNAKQCRYMAPIIG